MLHSERGIRPISSRREYPAGRLHEGACHATHTTLPACTRACLLAVSSQSPHHQTMCVKPEATFFPHSCRCSRERSPFCFLSRSLAYPASINGPTPALQDIGRSRSSLLHTDLEESQWISTIQPERLRPDVERPLREG